MRRWYPCIGKRLLDLSLTIPGLIIISPIMGAVALLIKIKLGGPVIFCQIRPGLYGKPFTIYKFRTMKDARDVNGKLLPDEQRLTTFGRLLRALSLDELPELFNVAKGEMSLVGPRPLLMEYLGRYSSRQARRHEALPGLTGWAQVNGRNSLTWEEKFEMDVWYVDNQSVWLDVKILFRTLIKVFRREGISSDNCATMPEFWGDKKE